MDVSGLEDRLHELIRVKLTHFAPNRGVLRALLRNGADPKRPLSPFSPQTREIRDIGIAWFGAMLTDCGVRIPKDLAPHLPDVLWLCQMGVIWFWVVDDSADQARTSRLSEPRRQVHCLHGSGLGPASHAAHAQSGAGPNSQTLMKIVIPGGSGQIGHILARHFHSQGHAVTVLSRNPHPAPWRVVFWDGVTPGAWITDLAEINVCINLAGRSVDCRYNAANRRAIYDSRIESARLLNQVFASLNPAPRLWINASTATIYRHALDRAMSEADGELGDNEPGAPKTWNFRSMSPKGGKRPSSPLPRRSRAKSPSVAR